MTDGIRRGRLPKTAPHFSMDETSGEARIRPREKLLEKIPPSKSRVRAFNQLHEHLAVATELYQNHGDAGKYGVSLAINEVMNYLSCRGIPSATMEPLIAVIQAISDAENGIASPIFAPRRTNKGSRPPLSIRQLEHRAHIAVVAECCVAHCKAKKMRPYREPGLQQAAQLIRESKWKETYTAVRLQKIREEIVAAPADSVAGREFRSLMQSPAALRQPLDFAKSLLKHEWVSSPPKVSK